MLVEMLEKIEQLPSFGANGAFVAQVGHDPQQYQSFRFRFGRSSVGFLQQALLGKISARGAILPEGKVGRVDHGFQPGPINHGSASIYIKKGSSWGAPHQGVALRACRCRKPARLIISLELYSRGNASQNGTLMERRIQLLSHMAFLVLCLVGIALGVRMLFWPAPPTPVVVAGTPGGGPRPERPLYTEGERLAIPGVSFTEQDYTLLLVTQKGCIFCDQSMPFYRALGEDEAVGRRVRIVLVAPDSEDVSRAELAKHGVRVDQVVQVPLGQLKVRGTPTAIVVNRVGEIQRVLPGLLDEARQAQLQAALRTAN